MPLGLRQIFKKNYTVLLRFEFCTLSQKGFFKIKSAITDIFSKKSKNLFVKVPHISLYLLPTLNCLKILRILVKVVAADHFGLKISFWSKNYVSNQNRC